MESTISFDLVSPDQLVFNDKAGMIIVPATEGDIGVLPGHSKFLSSLRPGRVMVYGEDKHLLQSFFVSGGFVEINPEKCIGLTEEVEEMNALDKGTIEQQVRKLENETSDESKPQYLIAKSKIEALKSQINPHFLFNTLASIASLVRSQPDTARTVIVKLSGLLRRFLRNDEHFVTLKEELESIDEYLDIEVVRFGSALSVQKQIAPDTLDVMVPSMILQPLVENSIKHGLSRKLGPGCITIRSRSNKGRAIIEVNDDGVGMLMDGLNTPRSTGIGLANVRERLRVIYGAAYQLKLTSEPGKGTSAQIEVPELMEPTRINV